MDKNFEPTNQPTITILHKDYFEVLDSLADSSIDLILTDPPYYSTDLHFDRQPRIDFKLWLQECRRVLKPNGVLVSFADFNLMTELRGHKVFKNAYEMVWSKNRGSNFMDVKFRPFRSHEFIIVFTNQLRKSTYNPQRESVSPTSLRRHKVGDVVIKRNNEGMSSLYRGIKRPAVTTYLNDGKRYPFSVLSYPVPSGKGKFKHSTQKPLELCEWLIRSYSNAGDTVLDTFAGSGTTLVACKNTGRNAIGCETHLPYIDIMQARLAD